MRSANLALRFLLELIALATLGYWGATVSSLFLVRVLFGIGAPLIAAAFWGLFVAPRARVVLSTALRMTLGLAVFACAAAALFVRGHEKLSVGFMAASLVNAALMGAWRQVRTVPRDPR